MLLPLTRREKTLLLNFALSGPGGSPAALTSRASTAGLQAQYLALLAQTGGAGPTIEKSIWDGLYEAIGAFTPGRFNEFLDAAHQDYEKALAGYLTSGLGLPITAQCLAGLRKFTVPVGDLLIARLGEPPCATSSSDEVLLALPLVDPLPRSLEQVMALLRGYQRAVFAAEKVDDEFFLVALAEYGRRFDVIVEVEVPLFEPSTIKIEEDVELKLSRQNELVHAFPLGDARSAHFEAKATDSAVEIAPAFTFRGTRRVTSAGWEKYDASGWIDSRRVTPEAVSLYGSHSDDAERPYYVQVGLKVRTARHLVATTVILMATNVLALVATLAVRGEDSYVERLAILTVPTTIAATFVLFREQTSLATRLQRTARGWLAASTVVLWLAVVACLVFGGASTEGESRPAQTADSTNQREYHSIGKERANGQERSKR